MEAYVLALSSYWMIYALLTLGLLLQFGFVGVINFGHVAFMAIGAYVYTLGVMADVPAVVSALLACVGAGLSALPIGVITSRLRGDYLAIVTLGFSEIVRLFIAGEQWLTNGVQGIPGIPSPFGMIDRDWQAYAFLGTLVVLTALAMLLSLRLMNSPYGRLVQAIRDNEEAARAVGKDPRRPRIEMLTIGAALAGAAGAAYAPYISFISPEQFAPLVTFYIWIAMLLGGANRLSGALFGSAGLVLVLEGSRFMRDLAQGISETQMTSVRMAIIGLAIVLFTLLRPSGIRTS